MNKSSYLIIVIFFIWGIFLFVGTFHFLKKKPILEDFYVRYNNVISINNKPHYFYPNEFNPYFPAVALLYLPYSLFNYNIAVILFFFTNLLLYFFSIYFLYHKLAINNILIFIVMLLFLPALQTIYLGNTNVIILFFLVLF
ncbi:MAG TPA: hypothetical protein PK189_01100, partial [bacterium]|nr:hypothetical protein [bacterium]